MPLAIDPFKQRQEVPLAEQKKDLLLSRYEVDLIVRHAQQMRDDDGRAEETRRASEGAMRLREAMVLRKKTGEETRRRQYVQELAEVRKDLAEEKKTQARKKLVLNMAYKRLYMETDRVKYFNAAKYLAELLKERDDQKSDATAKKENEARYDAQFLTGILRDIDDHRDEEREKERQLAERRKENAANWIKQHMERIQRKERERWENIKEGYQITDDAEKFLSEEKKKVESKKKEYQRDLDKQVNERLTLSKIHQRLEEVEEEKCKIFKEGKREMMLEHKKIREDIDREKNARKKRVAKTMGKESAELKKREEASLRNAIRQAEGKAKEENEVRQLKREQATEACKKFFEDKMAERERKKYEDSLRSFQEKRRVLEEVDRLKKIEDAKADKRKNLESDAEHIQLHQIAERRASDKAKVVDGLKEYMRHMRGLDDEEETFQKYAQLEIKKAEERGIDTRPMREAARPGIECGRGPLLKDRGHIRPRYYAATGERQDLPHTFKNTENMPDTKSRLGFMTL